MTTLYLLHHLNKRADSEEEKILVGVYASLEAAQRAVSELAARPELHERKNRFWLDTYQLDETNWTTAIETDALENPESAAGQ
ncbi:MAG TPA: hypothetical protein VI299_02045 [Polyangiales bacterium]